MWTDSAVGTLIRPVVGDVSESEPNGTNGDANRIEIGQDFHGYLPEVHENNGYDVDTFYFDGAAGQTIQMEGSTTYGRRYHIECYARPTGHAAWTGSASISQGRSCFPLVYTLPSTGRYFIGGLGSNSEQSFTYNIELRELVPDGTEPARDHRDVVMACSRDGGQTWSKKVLVNDDPPFFDNFLQVAVDGLVGCM